MIRILSKLYNIGPPYYGWKWRTAARIRLWLRKNFTICMGCGTRLDLDREKPYEYESGANQWWVNYQCPSCGCVDTEKTTLEEMR
jgi:hypothetical protein